MRWRSLGVGFYHHGRLAEMSTPAQLMTFPGLSYADRARLVRFVLRCRAIDDHTQLDSEPLEAWTRRTCGDGLWERLWRPLFDSKFDGNYDDLPATYLWSRMNRTAGTRDRKGHEVMGWIEGGYQAMVDALADAHPRPRRRRPDLDAGAVRAVLGPPRDRRRARRRLPPARHGRGDAGAPEPAAHARPRARARARARPPALPRHRLPGRARQAQRQPLLRPQHHGPPDPAHERRRDDARGRSGGRRRVARSTCRST